MQLVSWSTSKRTVLVNESLLLSSLFSTEELIQLLRDWDGAHWSLHPAVGRMAGSCCGSRGAYPLRVNQAARRHLSSAPATNKIIIFMKVLRQFHTKQHNLSFQGYIKWDLTNKQKLQNIIIQENINTCAHQHHLWSCKIYHVSSEYLAQVP